MAQQLKVLVTKPDDLNLVPGTHLVEGENQLLEALPDSHHCVCLSRPLSNPKHKCNFKTENQNLNCIASQDPPQYHQQSNSYQVNNLADPGGASL